MDCNNATPKASATITRPAIPLPLRIPSPPQHTQTQVDQAIASLITPIPIAQSTPRTGIMAILPSTATPPPPSPQKPTYSPLSSHATSTDSSDSEDTSPQNVAEREARLETSGASNTSKGSHRHREKERRSLSKRKRDAAKNPSSSSSSSRHPGKKKH